MAKAKLLPARKIQIKEVYKISQLYTLPKGTYWVIKQFRKTNETLSMKFRN